MESCKINDYLEVRSENGNRDIYIDKVLVPKKEYLIVNVEPQEVFESFGLYSSENEFFQKGFGEEIDYETICRFLKEMVQVRLFYSGII